MTRSTTETRPWDAAALLRSDSDIVAYLEAVLDEGDPALLAAALGDVARTKGMTRTREMLALDARACTRRCHSEGTRSSLPFRK